MNKKTIIGAGLLAILCMTVMAFTNSNSSNNGEIKDIDGNTYKTVKIGEQEWMS